VDIYLIEKLGRSKWRIIMKTDKSMGKFGRDISRYKLNYNDVYVTVFDKTTGRLTEYNRELDIIKSMRFPDKDVDIIDDPLWFVNIYGPADTLAVRFDSNGNWSRFIGSRPGAVEHSSGIREEFKYHDNGQIMFHKIITKDTVYSRFYNEDGTLIYNKGERKEK